jgi:hypothetical protein
VQLKMSEADENDKYVQIQDAGKAVTDNDGNLLFQNLNLLQKIDSVVKDDNKSKCDFLQEYAHYFNGVGAFPEKYTVRLEQGVQGIIQPPRRLPQSLITKLKSQLQEMVKTQIISKVEQPKEWASNLVLIEKK